MVQHFGLATKCAFRWGPQFCGEFAKFCESNGIRDELSAPYNPRSNALAESGLNIIKSILIKCLGEGKDVQRALYEWRNAPRQHGYSPAQLMFGRSQNILLPQPPKAFSPIQLRQAAEEKDKASMEQAAAYDKDKSELTQLLPGENVHIQCKKTVSWERIGVIVEIRPDKFSYLVDVDGKVFVRARHMLRPAEKGGVFKVELKLTQKLEFYLEDQNV